MFEQRLADADTAKTRIDKEHDDPDVDRQRRWRTRRGRGASDEFCRQLAGDRDTGDRVVITADGDTRGRIGAQLEQRRSGIIAETGEQLEQLDAGKATGL
jgi:hypothetical protein